MDITFNMDNFIVQKTFIMKKIQITKAVLATALFSAILVSCNPMVNDHEQEEKENAKIGKVYNPDVQGISQETHDNQFYYGRVHQGVTNDTLTTTPEPSLDASEQPQRENNNVKMTKPQ